MTELGLSDNAAGEVDIDVRMARLPHVPFAQLVEDKYKRLPQRDDKQTHPGPRKQLLYLVFRHGGEAVQDSAFVIEWGGPSQKDDRI